MMKQFDHMIEPKLNLELSNVFPRLKFLAGCGQFSDFSNIIVLFLLAVIYHTIVFGDGTLLRSIN